VYRALLLTGVAGVGKSTVAEAAGRVLTTAGCVTAVVDTDALAQFGPLPRTHTVSDRFHDQLKCTNLAALWANFTAVGARFLVVAAVIDSVPLRKMYAESLAGSAVQLVELTADDDTVRSRLRHRDTGPKLEKHLRALNQHRPEPTTTDLADFAVTNDRAAADVATEILVRAGWIDQVR